MKVGDLVELTFLDHGENEEVDLSVISTHRPVLSKVRGLVHKLDKCEGLGRRVAQRIQAS